MVKSPIKPNAEPIPINNRPINPTGYMLLIKKTMVPKAHIEQARVIVNLLPKRSKCNLRVFAGKNRLDNTYLLLRQTLYLLNESWQLGHYARY